MSCSGAGAVRWPLIALLTAAALATGCSDAGSDGAAPAAPLTSGPGAASSASPPGQPGTRSRSTPAVAGAANPWGRPAGVQVVASGLQVAWGLGFLPDGSAVVSERDTGRILQLRPGRPAAELARLPVTAEGEGGLLGVAVSPTYARDRLLYAYYTAAGDNRIVRFRPGARAAAILTGIPRNTFHNGGRIAFGPDGMLYAGTGDAGERSRSQDRDSLAGKILRMRPDGSAPPDNPFPGSLVWSLGHRNIQGLAWDDQRQMFATEFGQNRFDEVNRIRPGANYGWPDVEGRGGSGRYVDPLLTWTPEEASPSGMAFAGGDLYVAALRGERLWQVRSGSGSAQARALFQGRYGRLRHAALGPDGGLWLLTSNRDRGVARPGDDKVIRIPLPA